MTPPAKKISRLIPVAACLASILSSAALAEMAESGVRFPTDTFNPHLFTLNPAAQKPESTKAGVLLQSHNRTSKLDQSADGDDVLETTAHDDYVQFGSHIDLGQGAGAGIFHQNQFRRTESKSSLSSRSNKEEVERIQHSSAKITVELTNEVRAGMAMRYLYRDVVLYGDYFLQDALTTRYRTTLIGYGGGLAYSNKSFGGSYAYFPPLRGKADVDGEEKIIVESGETSLDLFAVLNPKLTIGAYYKNVLNDVDDRAPGTTASDDQTNISLYGLDLEQFVRPGSLWMLGGEYELSKDAALKFGVGMEQAEFQFIDLMRFNRLDVRQAEAQRHEKVSTKRARAAIRYSNKGIELQAGFGIFTREKTLPQAMNGAKYEASGRELFGALGAAL